MSTIIQASLAALLFIQQACAVEGAVALEPGAPTDLPAVAATHPGAGPQIWTFVKDTTTLKVLGTVQPLHRNLRFDGYGVRKAMESADALLSGEGVVTGEGIGLIRGLQLLPAMRRIKRNASGRTLRDVTSSVDYENWRRLAERYFPGNRRAEKLRPMYAAGALYEASIARNGLDRHHPAQALITDLTKKQGIPLLDARLHVRIADPEHAIATFHVDDETDLRCFRETLNTLQPWLDAAPLTGEAWRNGEYGDSPSAPPRCWSWLTNEAIAKSAGITLDVAVRERWMQTLRAASAEYATIFTTMPIEDLENRSGLVAALEQDGFVEVASQPRIATP